MQVSVAVLTSGGDSPGMNSSIRSVVRAAKFRGWDVWMISDGFEGLMNNSFSKADFFSVSHRMQLGGTFIGSARSERFRSKEGRREAVKQLCNRQISCLVVIGGDGSLTGANLLAIEWNEHLQSLNLSLNRFPALRICGLIGSIDNDFVGFSNSIGADSALQRIVYCIDCITDTAESHKRCFVIEVMGRSSGYLALAAAVICGADWVFVPEKPVNAKTWRREMCDCILEKRTMLHRKSIILLAEGAIDSEGAKINAESVKTELEKTLKIEARVTVLGHIQRGGTTSAFDRYQGTVLGVAAIDHFANRNDSVVLGMKGYSVECRDLVQAVKDTRAVGEFLEAKNFDAAFKSRGSAFSDFWEAFLVVSGPQKTPTTGRSVGVLCCGAPSPGMNHNIRAVVRLLLHRGFRTFFVRNGFHGLDANVIEEANWMSCSGWAGSGGCFLGTGRSLPKDINKIESNLKARSIAGLVLIGGHEAYVGGIMLSKKLNELAIAVVPATISNNCVGTEVSIGQDRAANNLVSGCDQIKQSCLGYEKRVFVVESIGRSCGFQSLFGAICAGAELVYIPERPPTLIEMEKALKIMHHRFSSTPAQIGLVINSENASDVFSTAFIEKLHENSSLGVSSRKAALAGLQQGGSPSPQDRIASTRLALFAVDHISGVFDGRIQVRAVGCGIVKDERSYVSLADAEAQIDFQQRRPKQPMWLDFMLHVFESVSFPNQQIKSKL